VFSICEGGDGACFNYRPVVMDKIFPIRPNVGPARVAAWEDGARRDSSSYAVYSNPDGSEIVTCALREDGTASHDITAGGTITIAATIDTCTVEEDVPYSVGSCPVDGECEAQGGQCSCPQTGCICTFERQCAEVGEPLGCACESNNSLESVYAVQLYETITIGRNDPPVEVLGTASVQLAPRPGAARYYVTVGCFSDSTLTAADDPLITNFAPCVTGDGEIPVTNCAQPGWITNRCAYDDNGPRINVYVEARDDNDEQEAFAFIPGVPRDGNNVFAAVVGVNDWKQVLDQDRFFVRYVGAPIATIEIADVGLGAINNGVLYQEGRKTSQLATGVDGPYFSPTGANVFQNVYSVRGGQAFGVDEGHDVVSSNFLLLNEVVADPPDTVDLDRGAFLPRFNTLGVAFSAGQATVSWNGDAGPGSYAGTDLGLATLFVSVVADGECSGAVWVNAFPGTAGPLVTPLIQNVPELCYQPSSVNSGTLTFYDNSEGGATVDVARADFYAFVPDLLRSFIFDYIGHAAPAADTVERSASTFFFPIGKR
jgi:hypothetical protein